MIGKIKGRLKEVSGNLGLIETESGISYEIFLTPEIISSYYNNQSIVDIYTYLHFREEKIILFGFENKKQQEIFKLLLNVSGVGPRTAFSIISFIKTDELISAVKNNDVDQLIQIPGLGKKTAMKIILELSSKINTELDIKNIILSNEDKIAVDGLISLGFSAKDAKETIIKLPKNLSIEEKIKEGLRRLKKNHI